MPTLFSDDVPHLPGYTRPPNPAAQLYGKQQARISVLAREAEFKQWGRPQAAQAPHRAAAGVVLAGRQRSPAGNTHARLGKNTTGGHSLVLNGVPSAWEVPPPPQPPSALQRPANSNSHPQSARGRLEEHGVHSSSHMYRSRPQHQQQSEQQGQRQQGLAFTTFVADSHKFSATLNATMPAEATAPAASTAAAPEEAATANTPWAEWGSNAETEMNEGVQFFSPPQASFQGEGRTGTRIETTSQAFDADAVVNNANSGRAGAPGIKAAGGRPRTTYGGPGAGGLAPQWDLNSNDALRFRCYYEEPNQEYVLPPGAHDPLTRGAQAVPRTVVRPVVLLFFLQDSSLAIHDWRVPNSGVDSSLGGRFLRRTTLYKQSVGPAQGGKPVLFDASDFLVGQSFVVNARTFTVVDADTRTREWFLAQRGMALAPALPIPDDGLAADRLRVGGVGAATINGSSGGGGSGGDGSGGGVGSSENVCPSDLIAPLLRDTTVLRFHAVGLLASSSTSSSAPSSSAFSSSDGAVAYTLLYFTQDDTIAVKARGLVEGLGHQFPLLLKRGRLPKDSVEVPGNDHFTSLNGYEGAIVTWQDLKCGEVLKVYGRSLLLISADAQTTEWYAERGISQTPLEVLPDQRLHVLPPQPPLPSGNGGKMGGRSFVSHTAVDMQGHRGSNSIGCNGNPGGGGGSVSGLVGSNRGGRGSSGGDNMSKYALGISLKPAEEPPKAPPPSSSAAFAALNKNGGVNGGESDVVLRFSAHMKDMSTSNHAASATGSRLNYGYKTPSPAPRKFVLAFHCADQTLSVYEPPIPNSGYQGGPFLARMRYKKHVPLLNSTAMHSLHLPPSQQQHQQQQRGSVLSRWFRASDFYLGADFTVELPSSGTVLHRFVLQDCDLPTRKWLESHGGGTYSDNNIGWGGTEDYGRGVGAGPMSGPIDASSGVGGEAVNNGGAMLTRLLERLAELLLAHKVNPRAILADVSTRLLESPYVSSLPTSSPITAAFKAGLLPEAVFMEYLRDHLGLNSPSMLSSADLELLVWEFAAPATVMAPDAIAGGLGEEGGAEAANLGLFVDAATFVDGLALHHHEPDIIVLQREWASALQSKPRGGAPLVSNTSPFGTSSNSGGSNTHSLEPVETRLLQRLQLQAGVSGDESTYSSPNNDDVRGEAWRLRRSFREAERHHHLHRGGEGYSGAVPMEVWFDVLKRHRFQDLLTRAQAESFARKFSATPSPPPSLSNGCRTENNRAATNNGTWVNYHALCDAVFPANFAAILDAALAADSLNQAPDSRADSIGHNTTERVNQLEAAANSATTARMLQPAAQHSAVPAPSSGEELVPAWESNNPHVHFSSFQSPPQKSFDGGSDFGRNVQASAVVQASPTTTVSEAMRKLKAGDERDNKDINHRLVEAMRSFASTFARPTRKAAFRKHCLALDTKFTGKLSRKWLQAAVETTVREENLNSYNPEALSLLLDFIYPDSRSEVLFEDFLELVLGRDVGRAHELRHQNLQQHGSNSGFSGDPSNVAATWGW